MLQKLEPEEARRNKRFFKGFRKTLPKFQLGVEVIRVNGSFLVHTRYSAEGDFSEVSSADMFRAKNENEIEEAVEKSLQEMLDLHPA